MAQFEKPVRGSLGGGGSPAGSAPRPAASNLGTNPTQSAAETFTKQSCRLFCLPSCFPHSSVPPHPPPSPCLEGAFVFLRCVIHFLFLGALNCVAAASRFYLSSLAPVCSRRHLCLLPFNQPLTITLPLLHPFIYPLTFLSFLILYSPSLSRTQSRSEKPC